MSHQHSGRSVWMAAVAMLFVAAPGRTLADPSPVGTASMDSADVLMRKADLANNGVHSIRGEFHLVTREMYTPEAIEALIERHHTWDTVGKSAEAKREDDEQFMLQLAELRAHGHADAIDRYNGVVAIAIEKRGTPRFNLRMRNEPDWRSPFRYEHWYVFDGQRGMIYQQENALAVIDEGKESGRFPAYPSLPSFKYSIHPIYTWMRRPNIIATGDVTNAIVGEATWDGCRAVVVEQRGPADWFIQTVVPDRGHLVGRTDLKDLATGAVRQRFTAHDFREVRPGVWRPFRWSRTDYSPEDNSRRMVKVSGVEREVRLVQIDGVNVDLRPDAFDFAVPADARVIVDKIANSRTEREPPARVPAGEQPDLYGFDGVLRELDRLGALPTTAPTTAAGSGTVK
ncbi:MAG TPA: hypothetical protein VK324_15970 [Tepidisphaeraceae bacterium]|nr:hypothetical protein [Tepidisphaeraceae bacterium]